MYTRRARVLFMATDPETVTVAVATAGLLAAAWIDAEGGANLRPGFDLVITLDSDAQARLAPHISGPYRHWPLTAATRAADLAARITALVGGMRLLARLDDSGAPGDREHRVPDGNT